VLHDTPLALCIVRLIPTRGVLESAVHRSISIGPVQPIVNIPTSREVDTGTLESVEILNVACA
jgi:hypothetical protein